MTQKRHTEEQMIAVLKDAQASVSVQDLCRKHGMSDATFYKWRAKYAGLEVSDVKKLRWIATRCGTAVVDRMTRCYV